MEKGEDVGNLLLVEGRQHGYRPRQVGRLIKDVQLRAPQVQEALDLGQENCDGRRAGEVADANAVGQRHVDIVADDHDHELAGAHPARRVGDVVLAVT